MNVNYKKFDCKKCHALGGDHCDEKGLWKMSKGKAEYPRFRAIPKEILEGLGYPEGLYTCPLSHIPAWWPMVRSMHSSFDKGNLMWSGGTADQPCTYMHTMSAITSYTNHYEIEKHKEDEEKRASK